MTPEQIDEIALTVAEGLFPCSITVPIDGQRKIIEFARRLVAEIQARNEPVAKVHNTDTPSHYSIITPGLSKGTILYTFPTDCEELRKNLSECRKECEEQARLNGMGSAREATLSTRLADAQRKLEIREQECEELRKDAGRYRWVSNNMALGVGQFGRYWSLNHSESVAPSSIHELDSAIDAAIAKEQSKC